MSDYIGSKNYNEWIAPDITSETNPGTKKKGTVKLLPTAEEIQNIYNQSQEEGFNKGYSDGLSTGEKKITEKINALNNIITILEKPLANISDEVINTLKELSILIAGQVIRRELTIDHNNIITTVQKSIDLLSDIDKNISIYLNPADVVIVEELLLTNNTGNMIIKSDPNISRGGSRIESHSSTIDATIEQQIRNISAEIIGGSRSDDT
jgi:flagellar assembly protein FliH